LLSESLDKSLAVAVKVDGQEDAYQVTNKFVAVSIVTVDGFLQNKFVSSEAPDGRGANGMLEAVKNGFKSLGWNWAHAQSKLCRVTTDGESANTGVTGRLWAKLQNETNLNLLTFWCAYHRSSLAFKSMMRDIPELKHLISDVVSVSTFYRVSGTRVHELESCAHKIDAKYYRWPQFKEVCHFLLKITLQLL
jgi:hypothetical protein